MRRWQHFSHSLDALTCQLPGQAGHPGYVSARPRKVGDQTVCDRVSGGRHDNRNSGRCLLRGQCRRGEPSHDQVDFEADHFLRQRREAIYLPSVRSELEPNGSPIDVAELAHRFLEQPPEVFRTGSVNDQHSDGRHFWLLGPGGERRGEETASDDSKECSSGHHRVSSPAA